MSPSPSVFLVGFMGSGKSSVGRALAERLQRRFVDSDDAIEAREGRTIAQIFAEAGEAHFRAVERDVLASLAESAGIVVASGGGAFCDAATRRRLNRRGVTIWLDVPLRVVERRIGDGRQRPLWAGRSSLERRMLFENRRAIYALACNRVDASRPIETVVDEILSEILSILR